MQHAYGTAEEIPALLAALRSADANEREKALARFYSAVHHQGDVYQCTTAALPFLFELADDAATPGRGAIVELLVSIGTTSIERCDVCYFGCNGEEMGYPAAAAMMRERCEAFVGFAADPDPWVRRGGIKGLAQVRSAAVAALWAVTADPDTALPMLLAQLDGSTVFAITGAADMLAQIGPAAAAAVPRLRELLAASYDWVRIHCAGALWEIARDAETPAVLDTLLQAWAKNGATANHVVGCLDRMGSAALPALPQLRSELAQKRRSGRYGSIKNDEELQRVSRSIVARLA